MSSERAPWRALTATLGAGRGPDAEDPGDAVGLR